MMSGRLIVILTLGVRAHPEFQSRVPNGGRVSRNGVSWPAVGHSLASTGQDVGENEFGVAFKLAGYQWTYSLCRADADGDGQSNGFELGDPDCVWKMGDAPARSTGISHPGFKDSTAAMPMPMRSNASVESISTPVPGPGALASADASRAPRGTLGVALAAAFAAGAARALAA